MTKIVRLALPFSLIQCWLQVCFVICQRSFFKLDTTLSQREWRFKVSLSMPQPCPQHIFYPIKGRQKRSEKFFSAFPNAEMI